MSQEESKNNQSIEQIKETKSDVTEATKTSHKGKSKFRNRVFVIFLLISLVPILIVSATSLYLTIRTRQQNIAELQNLAINNAYEKITKFLNQKMEGLNLVVSGKQSSASEKVPAKLSEANPNNLIFLLQKRWQQENVDNTVESINFIDNDNNVILKIDANGKIYLKKYFPDSVAIIHPDITQSDNIYDPNIADVLNSPTDIYGAIPIVYRGGVPIVPVSASLNNQNGEPIGRILTELNLKKLYDIFKDGLVVEKPIDSLKAISPDNMILLLRESEGRYAEKLKKQSTILRDLDFIDKTGETLGAIEGGQIILKLYSDDEITTLDSSIQFDDGQTLKNLNLDAGWYKNIAQGNNYLEIINCPDCPDTAGKNVLKIYAPLKNKKQAVIGALTATVDLAALNDNSENAKLGDATKKINEIDPNNLIYLLKSVKNTAGADGSITTVKFIDNDGEILAQIDENDQVTIKRNYWANTVPGAAIVEAYSTGLKEVDFVGDNAVDTEDFKTAIYGQRYFGQLELKNGAPTMKLASQFENNDRERIGVVSAVLDLAPIEKTIEEIKVGATGYLYVTDKQGNVIASPNKNFALMGEALADIPLVNSVLSGQIYDGLKKFTVYTNRNNEKVVFVGTPMMISKEKAGVDWYILSEWPQDDAYSFIKDIIKLSLLITLSTIIIIIFLGILFSRQIVKPIKSLVHGAQEIAKGNLDYKIKMRTHDEFDILSARFNEMVQILKENRKLRDEFVFISAHELRTPVTAIKGYLSMILDKTFGEVPPAVKENLEIVNASNERLVQLVNDLLEVARSEAGKMKINMAATPIGENVTTVLNELKSLSDKKGITVSYNEPELSKLSVMADPYKLKEVLTNLIGNAIKYTLGNGDIQITHEKKDNNLIIHIKDHGMGMTPEDVSKLFAKFYRVQNDKTAQIEGTGLGLFICKEIVERMNGKIWVESEVGKGSTFSFSLALS